MQPKNHILLFIIFCGLGIFSACRKTHDVMPSAAPPVAVAVSPALIKDSALMYARDFYLWYNQIPSTFDAKSYEDPAKIMEAIHPFSVEPGFPQPVDRWSFGMKKIEWDKLSSGISSTFAGLNATGDFGLGVRFFAEGDLRVKFVERESAAGLAGIQRSWRIVKINGNSNITTSNSTFIVDNVYKSASSSFTFIRPDGTSVDISLNAIPYHQHPVYLDSVYNIGDKHIGYLVFTSFLGDTMEINREFQRVFNKFTSSNVSDVIIDLRYNGGGYVSIQQKLANFLVTPAATGGLMMKEQYNDKHAQYNETTYFHKAGSFNPSHIYFIVTQGTASASELLINNLKPYMDVKLVGTTTHGKPVGFFPLPVGEWYVFPVSFRSTNKNGEGGYFNGIPVNSNVGDGLDKNWGDIQEMSLARAVKSITTGAFGAQAPDNYSLSPIMRRVNEVMDLPSFKGSIDTRGLR